MSPLDILHAGFPARGEGREARAALARVLWDEKGQRRLPSLSALDEALGALPAGELEWLCEFNPLSPLYFLPTREWLEALVEQLRTLGVKRVLEVGAGEGLICRQLALLAPELEVLATDSGDWEQAEGRMSEAEKLEFEHREVAGLRLGPDVKRLEAGEAIATFRPELVFGVWLPPGPLLDGLIKSEVKWVLDIGAAGGVTPGAWSWRFDHDQLEGPLETLGRCRLDERPAEALQTRVNLYFGQAHEGHYEEEVQEGDWLWQFRPV